MKVKLLPLAIGAAIAMPGVAMAEANWYGKLNVQVEMYDFDEGDSATAYDQWNLNSVDSRLGVKGSEDISDSLKAIYQAEFGIDVDDGSDGDVFSQRNIFVGLEGGFGKVIAGRFDTPLKSAQGKADQFGDVNLGDIKYVLKGENRSNNLIQYSSPKIADSIVATLAVQPGEHECTDSSPDYCNDGLADNFSASLAYSGGPIYAALAYDSGMAKDDVAAGDTATPWDITRLVVTGNMDAFEAGFIYQTGEQSEPDEADEQDGFVLSGAFKADAHKFKLQYGMSTLTDGPTDAEVDTTQIALGYENKLSKQTSMYVHYIMLEEEPETGDSTEETSFQLGMVHKF